MKLANKRVVALGGTSGIGLEVARKALEEGASVVISSNREESVESARTELALQSSPDSRAEIVDVSSDLAIELFFKSVGPFDHLIYTAGDNLPLGTLANTDLGLARARFQIRFWGAVAAVKYGVGSMREGGSIILTSGFSAARPRSGWTSQASIQSAVEGLARALAVELAPIRVNAVSPGLSDTPRWNAMDDSVRAALYESQTKRIPLARLGQAAEVATAYMYLMDNTYATGQVIVVDGGAGIA